MAGRRARGQPFGQTLAGRNLGLRQRDRQLAERVAQVFDQLLGAGIAAGIKRNYFFFGTDLSPASRRITT